MEQLYGWVILTGPAVLAWQGYSWLRAGIWTALPLSKTFTYFEWPIPATGWLGLQKIIDWIFDIPTSAAVLALSFVVLVICAIFQVLIESRLYRDKA